MRQFWWNCVAASAVAAIACGCGESPAPGAERVFTNGTIYTANDARDVVEALVIDDGRIVFAGSEVLASDYIGEDTRVTDLEERFLMPGFHDAHAHVMAGGGTESVCNLDDRRDHDEIRALLIACSDRPELAQGDWIVGSRWALAAFEDGQPPIEWLDEIFAGKPAYFVDAFGHSAWVSSSALDIAGIDAETPDPDDGVIERDPESGEPTGTLRDAAMALVGRHVPPDTPASLRRDILAGQRRAAEFGITAYTEPGINAMQAAAYKAADEEDALTARVLLSLSPQSWSANAFDESIFELLDRRDAYSGRYVSADSVKVYVDGVIETRTSFMLEPYAGGHDNFPPFYEPERLNDFVQRIDALGVQVHTHAIGDAAIRLALDAYEHAIAVNGRTDNRHQITHLQIIDEADIPRFGELGVAADFQALWAWPDAYIDMAVPIVGEDRVNRFYPIRSIVESGGRVVGGSDWDVSSLNPLEAIEAGITRQDPWRNEGPLLNADEAVDLQTMLDAYTRNAAWLMRLDAISGSLEVGKSADLIVLDRNLFEIPASEISEASVLLTVLGGRDVFVAPRF